MNHFNHRYLETQIWIACILLGVLLSGCGNSGRALQHPVNPQPQPGPGEEPVIPEQPRELAVGFEDGVTFTAGPIGLDMLAHDVDGDELPDIALRFLGGDLKFVYNDSSLGEIDFDTSVASIETEGQVRDLGLGDLNDDGRQDLFYLSGPLHVLLQDETGAFEPFGEYPWNDTSYYGFHLAVMNVNTSDNTLDVLLADERGGDINAVYFTPGELDKYPYEDRVAGLGVNAYNNEFFLEFSEMSLVDFEGNGLLDCVLTEEKYDRIHIFTHMAVDEGDIIFDPESGEWVPKQEGVFYGYQHARFERYVLDAPTFGTAQNQFESEPGRLDFGDINHDGLVDMAIECEYGGLAPELPWYTESQVSSYQVPTSIIWICETSIEPFFEWDDWENDDRATRSAIPTPRIGLTFPNLINDVKLADIDQDGELDVLGCCDGPGPGGHAFFYFPGLGDFEFGPPTAFATSSNPLSMLCEDFDGDGYPDVAVLLPITGSIEVFRNDAGTLTGGEGVEYEFAE